MNQTHKWIAYGLNMNNDLIIETSDINIDDSHQKAVNYLNTNKIDFDTIQLFEGVESK